MRFTKGLAIAVSFLFLTLAAVQAGEAQGIPQACITLNDKLAGDWYESNGVDSFLFPSHIRFIKQGPANGKFLGFSAPALYFLTEDCDGIGVTDTQGRLIVTYSAELNGCVLTLENWNRVHSYSSGAPPHLDIKGFSVNQDNPRETAFTALSATLPVLYGGSISSTSDNLKLTVEGACSVSEYTWSVTGDGASNYIPPSPSPTATEWNVGDIKPTPGRLTFKCQARLKNGQTINASKDVEVGIRTDDVIVIAWIDPKQTTLNTAGVGKWIIDILPPSGPSNFNLITQGLCFRVADVLSENYTNPIGNHMMPLDREYIMRWGAVYAANSVPPSDFLDSGGLMDERRLLSFRGNRSNYKLLSRFQIKYRVKNGKFTEQPIVRNILATTGVTPNACKATEIPLSGQAGPSNTDKQPLVLSDRAYIINDGSPNAKELRALNTLTGKDLPANTVPRFWENIGSRITFSVSDGSAPKIITQPYPTYFVYRNGRLSRSDSCAQPHTLNPNLQTNPYPSGTVHCSCPGGITPGGRCGDASSSPSPGARKPDYAYSTTGIPRIPPGGRCDGSASTSSTSNDKWQQFRSLWGLTRLEREVRLRTLLQGSDDETIAAAAARELISLHIREDGELIGNRLTSWSESSQLPILEAVLDELAYSPHEHSLLAIGRAALRKVHDGQSPASTLVVDMAALTLANSTDPTDRMLLRDLVIHHPQSRGLWLALVGDDTSPEELGLATSTYSNSSLPLPSRVAAALRIAKKDSQAWGFARDAFAEIDSQSGGADSTMFEDEGGSKLIGKCKTVGRKDITSENPESRTSAIEPASFIGMLGFSDIGRDIVFSYMDAENEDLRTSAALVGIIRWPEEFLGKGQARFSDEEYIKLLGFLVTRYPELAPEIERKFPKPLIDQARQRLKESGVRAVFGLAGSAVAGL